MNKTFWMMMVLLGLTAQAAMADIPGTINYQGRLTDLAGNAVTDGTYGVTFTLHYTAAGNSPTGWSEVQNVQTERGYFSIALGSSTPLSSLGFNYPYYLEIQVAGDAQPMSPRQHLSSVPYALAVKNDSITSAKIVNGTITSADVAGATITGSNIASGTIMASNIANSTITGGKIAGATITNTNIANGAIDTQAKAPWAPIVWRQWYDNAPTQMTAPKIACGINATDSSGDKGINISTVGFTSAPFVVCNPLRDVATYVNIQHYNVTTTSFAVRSYRNDGVQEATIFEWIAIGY